MQFTGQLSKRNTKNPKQRDCIQLLTDVFYVDIEMQSGFSYISKSTRYQRATQYGRIKLASVLALPRLWFAQRRTEMSIASNPKSGSKHVATILDGPDFSAEWGDLTWLVGQREMPGAEQTLGVVTIYPGSRNALHSHPNCEELLYVMSGECDHLLGEEIIHLAPGSAVRIPRGVKHWARCTSVEPLRAVISFSAPDRRTDNHEGDGMA
jgi:quercetin dioxygenase-like cupin family protein